MLQALCLLAVLAADDKVEVIQGATGSRSDKLEVQSGGLVLREGSAGAAFGTVQVGKGKRRLSYFVVIKHNLGKAGSSDFGEEANAEEGTGRSKQTLTIDGRTLEIGYEVRVDGKAKEALTINRKAVEVGKGRVFLVDLTASPPRWEQRKLDLPSDVSATTKKAADELVKKVLASLGKQDRKVKAFIDAAGRGRE
jgi:hypothetical protein